MKRLIACAVLATSTAHAAPESPTSRDPDTALTLSIIGTTIPVVAITLGFTGALSQDMGQRLIVGSALVGVITPALGEMYCGQWVTPGMGMRLGGLLIAAAGSVGLILWSEDGDGDGPIPKGSLAVVIAGGALYLGGAVSDIVSAPSSARDANDRLRIAPTLLKTSTGTTPGLSLVAQF